MIIEGSLEVKLPTIWTDEKQSREEAERRERLEERRSEKRKSQKKEDADARKGRKVAKHCVFPMIWGSAGSKSRRVRSQLARWEMKNCTPLWREAHFQVKMYKTHQVRTTFGSWDVEKVHAVVARSTLWSENVQSTSASDHFWKLRCRKSARRCGAKHISKSKCTKHTILGPLLAIKMLKKCTPLWREAHLEVKMLKKNTPGVRTTFGGSDVEKVYAVVARRTCRSQNVQNTRGSEHFGRFRCRFASLHYMTLHYTPLHYTTGHYTTLHYTTFHYTALHSTALHYTKLHYTTLHYTIRHSTTLHYTTLPPTTLHYITLRYNYNYNYTTTLH